jgi:hypothetical protein
MRFQSGVVVVDVGMSGLAGDWYEAANEKRG